MGTNSALVMLIDKITSALDSGNFVLGVFLDFSKAFDTVDHSILLKKLHHLGIRGNSYNWINDYLSRRKQFVMYNNYNSSMKKIQCGVPQGSILGPLLFLLYLNDISNVAPEICKILYADDTNLFFSDRNIDVLYDKMNRELSAIMEWLICNKLSLNVEKTQYILFSSGKKKVTI